MNLSLRRYWEQFEKDERKFAANMRGFFSRQIRPLLAEIRETNPFTIEDKVDSYIRPDDLKEITLRTIRNLGLSIT